MKNIILSICLACAIFTYASGQDKGQITCLDQRPGIYPIMLNDSVTKHLRILTPIGKIENGNGYVELDKDYCVIESANLNEVKATFNDLIIDNILFYVMPLFKDDCFNELVKLYGTPKLKGDQFYWETEKYVLTYELNPSDLPPSKKGQAIGLFMRQCDIKK